MNCDKSFFLLEAEKLLSKGIQLNSSDVFHNKCNLVISSINYNSDEIYEILKYTNKIKNNKKHLSFILAYLLLLAAKKLKNKELVAYCSFVVGRASIMINLYLEDYAIKNLQSSLNYFKTHSINLNNFILSQGRGAKSLYNDSEKFSLNNNLDEMHTRLSVRIAELIAKANRNLGQFENALKYYQKAIAISNEACLWELASFHEYCLGKMYVNYLKQPLRGLSYIQHAFDRLEKSGEVGNDAMRYKAIFLDEIGNVYRKDLMQVSKSIDYYKAAIDINKRILNVPGIARNLSHLGWANLNLGDLSKAEEYIFEGLKLTEKDGKDDRGIGIRLGAYGFIISKKGKASEGIECILKGLEINKRYNDYRNTVKNLMRISETYVDQKQYLNAVKFLRDALIISSDNRYEDLEILVSMKLGSLLCEHLKDYEDGYSQYLHAFNLHQKTWSNILAYIPGLGKLNDADELKLMYDSLISKYHHDSSNIMNLLNIALKESLATTANKEQHVLVSSIHRLKTPMTAIRNYFDYILQQKERLSKDDIIDKIVKAYGSMEHIEKTVNTFLDNIKTYSETQHRFNPYHFLLDKCKPYKVNFPDVNITISMSDRNQTTIGDKVALGTAFKEIILNACESASDTCHINVQILIDRRKFSTSIGYSHNLAVVIQDNGHCIPPNNFDRIFNKGFSTKKSGKGLGLNLASKIVKSVSGNIEVVNNDLGGCTFTIIIPVKLETE